jgi:hypothetical protein
MPVPQLNQKLELTFDQGLAKALCNHAPVTADNSCFDARMGNATWMGNKLIFSSEGLRNYWYLPDEQDRVSFCVVHHNGAGNAYVLSKNYGGCEYHELYHATTKSLAFLHVYKGSSGLATYTMAPGWTLRTKIYSKGLALRFNGGPVWSISCIDRSTATPTVESKFISVKGSVPKPLAPDVMHNTAATSSATTNPFVTIVAEDDGTNPPG